MSSKFWFSLVLKWEDIGSFLLAGIYPNLILVVCKNLVKRGSKSGHKLGYLTSRIQCNILFRSFQLRRRRYIPSFCPEECKVQNIAWLEVKVNTNNSCPAQYTTMFLWVILTLCYFHWVAEFFITIPQIHWPMFLQDESSFVIFCQ